MWLVIIFLTHLSMNCLAYMGNTTKMFFFAFSIVFNSILPFFSATLLFIRSFVGEVIDSYLFQEYYWEENEAEIINRLWMSTTVILL